MAPLKSFVASAEETGNDFSIQNLPLGVCRVKGSDVPRCCSRIGDLVVDLSECQKAGLLNGAILSQEAPAQTLASQPTLNAFAELGPSARKELRQTLQR